MAEEKNRIADKENALKEALLKKEIKGPVFYYATADSTMEASKTKLKSLSEDFAIVISNAQTHGRGRQEREWQSLPGNLFVTYIFSIQGDLNKYAGFSLVTGLSCSVALSNMGCRTRLKWPNDILSIGGKKLGGILIEIVQEGGKNYLLCGVGINLIASPDQALTTCVKDLTGESVSPSQMVLRLTPQLVSYHTKFAEKGFSVFRNEWNQFAAFIGRNISVHISKENKVSGMLMGVSLDGSLQLEREGKIQTITAGDVSLNEA